MPLNAGHAVFVTSYPTSICLPSGQKKKKKTTVTVRRSYRRWSRLCPVPRSWNSPLHCRMTWPVSLFSRQHHACTPRMKEGEALAVRAIYSIRSRTVHFGRHWLAGWWRRRRRWWCGLGWAWQPHPIANKTLYCLPLKQGKNKRKKEREKKLSFILDMRRGWRRRCTKQLLVPVSTHHLWSSKIIDEFQCELKHATCYVPLDG